MGARFTVNPSFFSEASSDRSISKATWGELKWLVRCANGKSMTRFSLSCQHVNDAVLCRFSYTIGVELIKLSTRSLEILLSLEASLKNDGFTVEASTIWVEQGIRHQE